MHGATGRLDDATTAKSRSRHRHSHAHAGRSIVSIDSYAALSRQSGCGIPSFESAMERLPIVDCQQGDASFHDDGADGSSRLAGQDIAAALIRDASSKRC
jgi:hypothetical protein